MINTLFGLEKLVTAPTAVTFLAALLIGIAFGFVLEYAGFSSSRKLSGIFYFRDMTVLRVMFTALITAMLGLSLLVALGWLDLETQVYVLPTVYGAQIVGGLIFGVGFALSGWCPGTGVVGVAAGKLDALVFLLGVVLGAIVFNETYGLTEGLRVSSGVQLAFGIDRNVFALLFTLAAVCAFYFAEFVEQQVAAGGRYLNSGMLRTLSVSLVIAAVAVFVLPSDPTTASLAASRNSIDQQLLEEVESEVDHMAPEELAAALVRGDDDLLVIDVRPVSEFEAFHLPGAVNVSLPELPSYLDSAAHAGRVLLYSNGMTHPAQARDALVRLGYDNVYMLTDGLTGFVDRCLKPVSLRSVPLQPAEAEQVRVWRSFFLGEGQGKTGAANGTQEATALKYTEHDAARLISTVWLEQHLGDKDLRIIDCRTHADYTQGHVPGAVYLNLETIRGAVAGIPSMVLPSETLIQHLSLLGIDPNDMVVFDPGEGVRNATLISMALRRVGHQRWGILHGGFPKWSVEKRPIEQAIRTISPTKYSMPQQPDEFTVDAQYIASRLNDRKTVLIDTRPNEYFTGEKSREMRPGRIPGSVNRMYKEDLDATGNLKPTAELQEAYDKIIPAKDTPVIVYCRTGHQASLTFFVLKEVLGYSNVKWYDASWTDWATRDLPAEKG